ncbi:MAG: response regulator transcription factor [Clostridiales Family XIII bacterium]|nr:response regulator transcription factor [Clostridiales Family XIII bacterium]
MKNRINILAIDDDEAILSVIRKALTKDGYTVDTATNTTEITLKRLQFADLILLDVMMPEEDGFSFLSRIRDCVDAPILFVTAKVEENNLIRGLGLGADDYIIKPFSLAELRARVAAHLRREKRVVSNSLRLGNVRLDFAQMQVFVNEKQISLTKSEYKITETLMEHAGQVFSKEQIYELVYGYDAESDYHAVVEHIKNLRLKLKVSGVEPIETVWGIGYKWQK